MLSNGKTSFGGNHEPTDLPQWVCDLGELDSLSTAGDKLREMRGRSGRGEGAHTRLVSQSPDPDQWRVSVTLPLNSMECDILGRLLEMTCHERVDRKKNQLRIVAQFLGGFGLFLVVLSVYHVVK